MTTTRFADLGLAEPLLLALADRGHDTPTPIQARAIPELISGRDLLGVAQTGTGKTGAFALPILHRLRLSQNHRRKRAPRALILAPTRELAVQIHDELVAYAAHTRFRMTCIFGGVGQGPQVRALDQGVDVLVATPGRLMDLMGQGRLTLGAVEHFVLDEADRMLDMGFVRDVRKIAAELPAERQSLLFSATMPKEIAALAAELLRDPVRVEVTPQATTVEKIAQTVRHVAAADKPALLAELLADRALSRVIVFSRTKHGADRIAKRLHKDGVPSDAIHGNKSQSQRQRALGRFKSGEIRVLVATDIAARGIDVDGVSHVVNFDLPVEPESYVHRIGRTARAGASGEAIAFCAPDERGALRAIERLIGMRLEVIGEAPAEPEPAAKSARRRRGGGGRPGGAPKPVQAGGAGTERPRGKPQGDRGGAPRSDEGRRPPRRRRGPRPEGTRAAV